MKTTQKRKARTVILLGALALLIGAGCSTTRLSLHTSPSGTKVYGKPLGSGSFQLLGETPLSVQADRIEKQHGGSGPVVLEFRKEGFQTATTLITELNAQDLDINLEMVPQGGFEDLHRINEIIDVMFECQRLVKVKRYDEALARLKEVEKKVPQISAIYELQGGVYYLQRKYQDALDAYRMAVRYNPRNAEAIRMREMLEKAFGINRVRSVMPESAPLMPEPGVLPPEENRLPSSGSQLPVSEKAGGAH